MASVLDLGIMNYFIPAFIFILVFVIVGALLEKSGFFGKNKVVNWTIALAASVLFLVIPEMRTLVTTVTPFFIMLMVFLVLLLLIFLFMGFSGPDIVKVIAEHEIIAWTIILLALGIMGYAITLVYGDQIHAITSPTDDAGGLEQEIGQIIFHPKVIGVVFILLIAALAVKFISTTVK